MEKEQEKSVVLDREQKPRGMHNCGGGGGSGGGGGGGGVGNGGGSGGGDSNVCNK